MSQQLWVKEVRKSCREFHCSFSFVPTTLGQREHVEEATNEHEMPVTVTQPQKRCGISSWYIPVLDALTAVLERQFSKESMQITEACGSLLRCHKNGIHLHPLLQKYAESLKINPQLAAAEMDLFTRTESVVTLQRLLKELSQRMYQTITNSFS